MAPEIAPPTSYDNLDPAVADAVRAARVVLVPVDDGKDAARERSRRVAQGLAKLAGAKLVLLDRVDTTYADTPRVNSIDRAEAQRIDRPYLVAQIDEANDAGVEATAFQHSLPGAEALTDTAKEVGADLIVVPADIDKPGFLDRFRHDNTAERAVDAAPAGVRVVSVGDDGSLRLLA